MNEADVTSNEIRKRIRNLLGSIFKLTFALLFLRTISGVLNPNFVFTFSIADFTITEEIVFGGLSLVFIIYYGYGILTNGSFLLDAASKAMMLKLGTEETKKTKAIAYDVTYLIALVLAAEALVPIGSSVPDFGPLFVKVMSVTFIALGFLITYHLARSLYSLMTSQIDQAIKRVSQIFEEVNIEEERKGRKKLSG